MCPAANLSDQLHPEHKSKSRRRSCILAGEVFFLEVTVGFKTENVTVGFTGVIGAEQFGIIVPLCYFSLGVTDVEVGIYVEVAEGMAPVQVQLPSTCT